MSILSDKHIRSYQSVHDLVTPFVDSNVGPASIDLTLGQEFKWIEMESPWDMYSRTQDNPLDSLYMNPGQFVLATTAETVKIPRDIVAQVNGKSSWARKGLIVHTTAGFIDPGFEGQITLELKNVGHETLVLTPGVRICQLVFTTLTSPAVFPYGHESLGSHYQNQSGVQESWM